MDRAVDKRLIERSSRRFDDDIVPPASDMPDLEDRLRASSDEDLERVGEELVAEQATRRERIDRQMTEDKSAIKLPEIPFAPIPESEL